LLETLHGRLKWKQTHEGIFVAIPARRGALTHLYGPLVGIWLIAAAIRYSHLFKAQQLESTEVTLQLIAVGIYVFGFIFAVCWLVWTFSNETTLIIDPEKITIQRRVIAVELSSVSFPITEVRSLRFIPPTGSWASLGETDPKTSKIQFQAGGKTQIFAAGVTEKEAMALFASMNRVYKSIDYLHVEVALATYDI
jgi:hypothetical protein